MYSMCSRGEHVAVEQSARAGGGGQDGYLRRDVSISTDGSISTVVLVLWC